jgi:hypothetical protein
MGELSATKRLEISHQDRAAQPAQRMWSAVARLDGIGWVTVTLAGLLSALEEMEKGGVPHNAQLMVGWPTVWAYWNEDV